MGSQMIQIIILAGIALFLVLRLRNVLGTREGFEKPSEPLPAPARRSERPFEVIDGDGPDLDIADFAEPDSETGKALAAMKRIDRRFTVADFTHGARQAYEMLVMAYEKGDLDTLRQFLAANAEPASFQPMARRWLVRLLEERKPPLTDFATASQVIAGVEEGTWPPSKALDPLLRAARGQRLG